MRSIFPLLAVVVCWAVSGLWSTPAGAAQEQGYIEMADGVGLRYTVLLPDTPGPHPVLLQYQGYGAGSSPNDNGISLISAPLLDKGFAILGVNLRGTGCSEGNFDLFEHQWVEDGYAVIQWAASRSWSNGNVAMIGLSFPAITQLMVAPTRPPALKAAMPWSALTDLYRDVTYPGGIFNQSFAAAWTGIQKDGSQYYPAELEAGNDRCAGAFAGQNTPDRIVFEVGQTHPWSDSSIYERLIPEGTLQDIDIPMLVAHAWQDEQLGSRQVVDYEDLDPEKTWFIYGNGPHGFGLGTQFVIDEGIAFLSHFMLGENNGFEKTPHVQVLHEVGYDGVHRWVSHDDRWPATTALTDLYFTPDGTLDTTRPTTETSFDYAYPLPAPSMTAAVAAQQENQTYQVPVSPGGAVVFTSAPLAHDLEVLGPIRADVWLSTTLDDTDVQVSLTEVRPDGQEQYVQRGWLRASHRKMDLRYTRADRPYQTHREADAESLTPGEPTELNIEVWPIDQVFRAGSSLRISIEAPMGTTGFRDLQILTTPSVNTVYVGGSHLSHITIPVVPGASAPVDYATCGSLINEPCKTDLGTVPQGSLSVPAALAPAPTDLTVASSGSDRFSVSNTASEPVYLRAVVLDLGDASAVGRVVLHQGDNATVIDSPFSQTRFELPETAIQPGGSLPFSVELVPRRTASLFGAFGNVAFAVSTDGPAQTSAAAVAALLAWLALGVVALRTRGWLPKVMLIAAGLLVGCSSSELAPAGSTVAGKDQSIRVVSVEAVNAHGQYVGTSGLSP